MLTNFASFSRSRRKEKVLPSNFSHGKFTWVAATIIDGLILIEIFRRQIASKLMDLLFRFLGQ